MLCVVRTKECVGEGERAYVFHIVVLLYLGVHDEVNWHVHRLSWSQRLLIKAKALNLDEIRSSLLRGDIVRGHSTDRFLCNVRRIVECKYR